jgi:hypothetical protein
MRLLKLAERSSARVMMDGGFHYCKVLSLLALLVQKYTY